MDNLLRFSLSERLRHLTHKDVDAADAINYVLTAGSYYFNLIFTLSLYEKSSANNSQIITVNYNTL